MIKLRTVVMRLFRHSCLAWRAVGAGASIGHSPATPKPGEGGCFVILRPQTSLNTYQRNSYSGQVARPASAILHCQFVHGNVFP